jgi:hypothetical protein
VARKSSRVDQEIQWLEVLWPSHKVRLAGDVQDKDRVRVEDISAGTPVTFNQMQAVMVVDGGPRGGMRV